MIYDSQDYSLLLVWRQGNARTDAEVHRDLEATSSGL